MKSFEGELTNMRLTTNDLVRSNIPLMLSLSEPMETDESVLPSMGAMTKYKTFNGEKINGAPVWRYDHHNDDD